jgi:hypothetical protein
MMIALVTQEPQLRVFFDELKANLKIYSIHCHSSSSSSLIPIRFMT